MADLGLNNRGLRLAGSIYVADLLNDVIVDGSFVRWGNCDAFNASPQGDAVDIISNEKETYGQALETTIDPKPTQFSFDINTHNAQEFAEANLGSYVARAGAGGSASAEGHIAHLEKWILADNPENMTSMVVTDTTTGLITYVEGTDYIFKSDLGIKPIDGGAITEALGVDLDYTHAAETGYLITAGTNQELEKFILIDGIDRFTNTECRVNILKAKFRPTSDIALLNATEPIKISFGGTLVTPTGAVSPYNMVYRKTA